MNDHLSPFEFYDEIAAILDVCQSKVHASYLQGHWCGMAVKGHLSQSEWLALMIDQILESHKLPQEDLDLIASMIDWTRRSMVSSEFDFQLIFPADDLGFWDRAQALVQWVQGCLDGFGISGVQESELNESTRELLRDMVAISQMDLDAIEGNTQGEGREEFDLLELYEYVRMSALSLNSEWSPGRVN